MEYRVIWEIEIGARNPREAAKIARAIQRDPKSLAGVFECVNEKGQTFRVDLDATMEGTDK